MAITLTLDNRILTLTVEDESTSVDLSEVKGDMGVRGPQGCPGKPSITWEDLTEEQKAELTPKNVGAMVVNAIDTIETQTEAKSTSSTVYNYSEYSYSAEDISYVVKDGRSNYTINGEPATVITVPSVTVWEMDWSTNQEVEREYSSYLGLESATWKMEYLTASSYAIKGITCKDGSVSDYEVTLTITYDENVEIVTTTIDTPFEDIQEAIEAGKDVICKWGSRILRIAEYHQGFGVEFTSFSGMSGNYAYLYRVVYTYSGVTAEKRRFSSTIV